MPIYSTGVTNDYYTWDESTGTATRDELLSRKTYYAVGGTVNIPWGPWNAPATTTAGYTILWDSIDTDQEPEPKEIDENAWLNVMSNDIETDGGDPR